MAVDSIQIVPLKEALIEQLTALRWRPVGNTSDTHFIGGVFRTTKIGEALPSPWAFVVDESPDIRKRAMGGLFYEKRTPLTVYICSSYQTLGEEEAEDRLIYAYEAVEALLTDKSVMDAILAPGYSYKGWQDNSMPELKVHCRKLTLEIQSKI